MEKNRTFKVVAVIALFLAIVGTGVAFAAYTEIINITGSAKVKGPDWKMRFVNLGSAIETGEGTANGTPSMTDTAITNVKAVFEGTGTVAYEFDVINDGVIDAKLGTVTILPTPTCTGNGTAKLADEALVCGSISTTLKYVVGGTTVTTGASLDAGDTIRMVFTITYTETTAPENEVEVTGLGATLIYSEK